MPVTETEKKSFQRILKDGGLVDEVNSELDNALVSRYIQIKTDKQVSTPHDLELITVPIPVILALPCARIVFGYEKVRHKQLLVLHNVAHLKNREPTDSEVVGGESFTLKKPRLNLIVWHNANFSEDELIKITHNYGYLVWAMLK